MKLFLIATMIFGGGTAVAATNEETVSEFKTRVRNWVEHRREDRKEQRIETIKENGLQYPKQEFLDTLTEEQELAIVTLIDQYNAEYVFSEMTDEEIFVVLDALKLEMDALFEELGIEKPEFDKREYAYKMYRQHRGRMQERFEERLDELRTDGLILPEGMQEKLTDEELAIVQAKLDELNETYDFSTMTDEEIKDAMFDIKDALRTLHDELGITPETGHHRHR